MHHSEFLSQIDDQKVLEAIRGAEAKTSGEIRVFVSHHQVPDALDAARKQFKRLGMMKTKQRNGVLIFLAPKSRAFAVFGDVAIHEKCGEEFWNVVRDQIVVKLKAGEYTAALVHAVGRTGEKLREYFPAERIKENQLPDGIVRD